MASSTSKSLAEILQPVKRLRSLSPSRETLAPRSCISIRSDPSVGSGVSGEFKLESPSNLTVEQRSRMEFNKYLARSKRNARLCIERIENAKAKGIEYAKLEELLVEETWLEALPGELQNPHWKNLCRFVESELRGVVPIYPPPHLIFNALNSTPFDRVKAVIIGQDPYHGPGQAMGLAFSVPEGIKPPSSLINIFKELHKDVGCSIPMHGNLERWAVQGVLLLNTVLTVRKHQANSHATKGWEPFTDAVIRTISEKKRGIVFILWGNSAQEKSKLIDPTKHHILKAAHPSGLSANRGFFGCRSIKIIFIAFSLGMRAQITLGVLSSACICDLNFVFLFTYMPYNSRFFM
ncbi:uracil-DNA glycosylase, mitochondrial isoform X1 [Dendrobium catenatum]|uniref:uracil-DNA glycosylase, mitochondrial isoform X1 n=1 Tax=Dendrobium catenatum TaxID=906689 RepID=UPI00109F6E7A|nr:uracil-DNA glycosylase, mitochondrial isoform X1 [Dendrobium catenatum]